MPSAGMPGAPVRSRAFPSGGIVDEFRGMENSAEASKAAAASDVDLRPGHCGPGVILIEQLGN